jgi:diguanylate cyclase (GGDEF)-like protein
MKKHLLLISNLIIIFAIVAGFTGIVYRDTTAYQQLAEKHLENIVSLADTDISNHIENSMSKPVMVSKTMANDTFLKTWLTKETENSGNTAYLDQLYNYLKTYQLKYGYTTVFCVSAQTGNYYYQDGLNKTISSRDAHDVWYFNFVNSGHEYDLEVDTNQANNDSVSVFVNFRVEAADGTLLGIIGVGLQASFIEDTIRSYEKNYDLSIYIVNVGGAENSYTGSTDIFVNQDNLPDYTGITGQIELSKSGNSEMQWFTSEGERKCLITKYNDTLGWYLILEMRTSSISQSFKERIKSNIFFMLISLFACILVTTLVFHKYNERIVKIENTDELTGLPNRKLFSKQYFKFIRKQKEAEKTLFMLDIDHFKYINDMYGHMFGNSVLAMVGNELDKSIKGHGIAARWGGDEFIGILALGIDESKQILRQFMDTLRSEGNVSHYSVTVSIGIAKTNGKPDTEKMIKEIDEALYRSKREGRDCITIYELE